MASCNLSATITAEDAPEWLQRNAFTRFLVASAEMMSVFCLSGLTRLGTDRQTDRPVERWEWPAETHSFMNPDTRPRAMGKS